MPQVSVEPLLPQHRGKRSQQRHQKARKQETIDGDNLAGRVLLNGEGFIWDCGMVEGEEDDTEESCRLVAGIRLNLFVDIDDKGRTNSREQARLRDSEIVDGSA